MALSSVQITPDVLQACMTHALTTEAEEIMGLLLGDVQGPADAPVAHIWKALPQIRTDRRKDRVETSPEQMASCSAQAEQFSAETGVRTRVVGWYHSHPHITVLPSHVDVHTQAMYQMLDAGFVGLIFSVFNADGATKAQHVHVTAFQSMPKDEARGGVLQGMSSAELEGLDQQTRQAIRDATAAEQLATTSAQWIRRELPLFVAAEDASSISAAGADDSVYRTLLAEERSSYEQALASSSGDSGKQQAASWVTRLHGAAVYQQALCELMELVLAPAVKALQLQAKQAAVQEQQLHQQSAQLKEAIAQAPSAPMDLL